MNVLQTLAAALGIDYAPPEFKPKPIERRPKRGVPTPQCEFCVEMRGRGPNVDRRGRCPREWAHEYMRRAS